MDVKLKILQDTFENRFSLNNFLRFSREFFGDLKIINIDRENTSIPSEYLYTVSSYWHLATYTTEKKSLDIFAVKLKSGRNIERARSMQRSFISKLLSRSNHDGAIVAFFTENDPRWRLSFIRLDYEFAAGRVKMNLTPAKRYSYLVGEKEPCHTAMQQLFPIFRDENYNPTFDRIEEAFSVERVTKDFFEKYKNKYTELLMLTGKLSLIEGHNEVFCKKLMGQIVFLYFLQKKGWLGVDKDSQWGYGNKNYIQDEFKKYNSRGLNYFNDFLKVLFKELNNDSRKTFSNELNYKVPFLNGELFDTNMKEYDDIIIENEFFRDSKKTGVLDYFDIYNFTVNENNPLDMELGIDPEMLGEIFQRLLDVKTMKDTGSFYTPKEIVHYMCQETLTNYLVQQDVGTYDEVSRFIKDAEGHANVENYSFSIRTKIDKTLDEITVLDPAVGSGAFILGMLLEIVNLKTWINPDESVYKIKRNIIQNSLYAIDIQPSAVDITKLRLYLSLLVDEDVSKSNTTPKTLPNLNYHICCGNSLISKINEIDMDNINLSMPDINTLISKRIELFNAANKTQKNKLLYEITLLEANIIKQNVDDSTKSSSIITDLKHNPESKWFFAKLKYPQVFIQKTGFDVIIGNPPYGAKFTKKDRNYLSNKYPTVPDYESADFFVDRSCELLREKGVLSFIIPNMFMSNVFANKYRGTLLQQWSFLRIDNLSDIDVFESAKVRNCIIYFEKSKDDFSCKLSKLTIQNKNIYYQKEISLRRENLKELMDNWLSILEQTETEIMLINKIKNDSIQLKTLCDSSQGLIPYDKYRGHSEETIKNRIWHSSYQSDDTYRKELAGKDIDRYTVHWNGCSWISYGDWLAAPRKKEYFTLERILIREITNPRILAAYTNEEFYNTPSIINCVNFSVDIFFVLGVINSKLLSFYHILTSPKAKKGLFPKILVNDIRNLPIKIGNEVLQNEISKKASYIQGIDAEEYSTKRNNVDKEIDRMVYELYGLTDDEIKIVEESFK